MKNLGAILLAGALAVVSIHADAARLGGGKSVGRQSGNVTQRQATPPAATPSTPATQSTPATPPAQSATTAAAKPATPPAATPAPAPKRPWAGILGGIAAGLGLAWLANSLGLGAAFGNFLLILLLAVAALAAWRFFSARSRGSAAPRAGGLAYQGAGSPADAVAPAQYSPKNVGNDASARPWE